MKKLIFGFSLIVMSAVVVMASGNIDNNVQKAVNGLSSGITKPVNVTIGAITLTGTKDMTSGLSVNLYNRVKYHAERNKMFNVVDVKRGAKGPNDPKTGIISGTYTINGSVVEIYLELEIDGKTYSQRFNTTVDELELMDIAILPDNFNTQNEAQEEDYNIAIITDTIDTESEHSFETVISTPDIYDVPQDIDIQVWFDSQMGSRTYLHREQLKITLMADKDCYFKLIHIDSDGKVKMIYPNSSDRNNELKANTPRTIFETANYMFYGPYGAETILIAASTKNFKNIEQDYITPWVPATAESVKSAVRGKGGDLEGIPASLSEYRYTITILKPHEEYEYSVPSNMAESVQNMKNEVLQQGGTFEGNETSGFSVVNNVRTSYRIPREAPDTIQVAYYYLDNFSLGTNAKGQKKLNRRIEKISEFLENMEKKEGKRGKETRSNVTDNESALI
ncbi:DUF4384 domain-containing protein, partial [Treponema sp. R8-4-B8]